MAIVLKIEGSWAWRGSGGTGSTMQGRSKGGLDHRGAVEEPEKWSRAAGTAWVTDGLPGEEDPSVTFGPPQ